MTHTQVTYSTVDCAVVDAATISNACAALTTKTVAAYPDLTVIGCTGECGSLVLRLQIDDGVPAAIIVAVETAVAADPALVAVAIVTAAGSTVTLTPSAFVFQGTTVAATATVIAAVAQPATGGKSKTNKKGKKDKKGKKGEKTGKVAKGTAAKGKGKKGKVGKMVLASTFGPATGSPAVSSKPMMSLGSGLAVLGGLLIAGGVLSGKLVQRTHWVYTMQATPHRNVNKGMLNTNVVHQACPIH